MYSLHLRHKGSFVFLGLLACLLLFPGFAFASGGITEFSSPLEQVVNTITGPAGKWISIVAMDYASKEMFLELFYYVISKY